MTKVIDVTSSGTRILLHPQLKKAHSLWKSGKLNTGQWCNIFQHWVYSFPIANDLIEFANIEVK